MNNRIPTKMFIDANIAKCQSQNVPVYIVKKGDPNSGMIVLKVLDSNFQCRIFSQMRDIDGDMKWFDRLGGETVSESEAGVMAQSIAGNDPDIWIVEVETRDGKNPFDGDQITI